MNKLTKFTKEQALQDQTVAVYTPGKNFGPSCNPGESNKLRYT